MLEIPCKDTKWEQGKQYEGLFPSCAVTRAMAKAIQSKTHSGKNDELKDDKLTFIKSTGIFPGGTQDSSQSATTNALQLLMKPHTAGEPRESVENMMLSTVYKNLLYTRIRTRKFGSSSNILWISRKHPSFLCANYFVKNGVLMRKWRPPDVEASHEWKIIYQIIVPPAYQHDILSLAHETPLAGHLDINKTHYKMLNHFYWPGLRGDTKQFCKTCHTSQLVGRPNGKPPIAPLKPIPEPFSCIIVDCVGSPGKVLHIGWVAKGCPVRSKI